MFPSLEEGFGLTPLEAMRCGAAVIASNTTSLPEVIGLEEAQFDPCDVAQLTKKMQQVLSDPVFHARLREPARNNNACFPGTYPHDYALMLWKNCRHFHKKRIFQMGSCLPERHLEPSL